MARFEEWDRDDPDNVPRHGGEPVDPWLNPWEPPPVQPPPPPSGGPVPGRDETIPGAPPYGPPTGPPPGAPPGYEDPGFPEFSIPDAPTGGVPDFNLPDLPEFNPTMFSAPSFEDAQNEPGYQFRLQSGADALSRSAAARGVLRTGGTLKDVLEYGQNFGAQEYNNVFNRALQAYGTTYQAEKDQYAPRFAEWQFGASAERDAQMAAYQRAYDVWATQVEAALRREQLIQNAWMMPPPAEEYGA